MTERRDRCGNAAFALLVYWGCILLGLALPGLASVAVDVLKHGESVGHALHQWRIHLFAPGYNLFLIAVLNAAPFVVLAVFALLHLGSAALEAAALRRRKLGVLFAALAAIGLSAWTHLATLWHPDAQGALAYVFLPIVLAAAIPVAYLLGWASAFALQARTRGARS